MSPIHSLPPNPSADQIKNTLNKRFTVLTTIVIDSGNSILDPDPPKCGRGGPVGWIVYNNDKAPHTVAIDPGKFKIKGTSTYVNPLVGNKLLSVLVNPGDARFLDAIIKPDAQFQTYKYTISSDKRELDPDLDVVDP